MEISEQELDAFVKAFVDVVLPDGIPVGFGPSVRKEFEAELAKNGIVVVR